VPRITISRCFREMATEVSLVMYWA
jgi:hypothetical protein